MIEMNEAFQTLAEIIRCRRTAREFNGQPVSKSVIETLLECAAWAPNHRMNEPWKFLIILPSGIQHWIEHLKATLQENEQKLYSSGFQKLKTVGALIFVTSQRDPNPLIEKENYAATCAAVQNLLLAATALELASYWSTGALMTCPQTLTFFNIAELEQFVAAVWIGYGTIPPPKPRTDFHKKTRWIE